MKRIMCLALFLGFGFQVRGEISLWVGGEEVDSVTVELGSVCEVAVISDDGERYNAFVGFDDGVVRGVFDHAETAVAAGDLADVTKYDVEEFSGYYVRTDSLSEPTSAGAHFVFEYRPKQLGTAGLKLYDATRTTVLDSVDIVIVPEKNRETFTYQGRLHEAGSPAEGLYDMRFRLFDQGDPEIGTQQGPVVEAGDIAVTGGYFQAELDFGAGIFNGDVRWLEIAVRAGASGDPNDYVTLSERSKITPGPYAIYSARAADAEMLGGRAAEDFALGDHGHGEEYCSVEYVTELEERVGQLEAALVVQGERVDQLFGLLEGVTRDANDIVLSGVNLCIVNGSGATDGEVNGLGNLIVGYNEFRDGGNVRTGSHNVIVGTEHNYSSYGGFAAGYRNFVSGPYAAVSGGIGNEARGAYSSVTGGTGNIAEGTCSLVTGGYTNTASGYASGVLGGYMNFGVVDYALVVGGRDNRAEGYWSVVTGGQDNVARGKYSSVSGGKEETVEGDYDWRAGDDYFADE